MAKEKGKPPKAWFKKLQFQAFDEKNVVLSVKDAEKIWDDLSPYRKREIKKVFGEKEKTQEELTGLGEMLQKSPGFKPIYSNEMKLLLGKLYEIKTEISNQVLDSERSKSKFEGDKLEYYYLGRNDVLTEMLPKIDRIIANIEVRLQYAIQEAKKEFSKTREHKRDIEKIEAKKPKAVGGRADIPIKGIPVGVEGKYEEKPESTPNEKFQERSALDVERAKLEGAKKKFKPRFERL